MSVVVLFVDVPPVTMINASNNKYSNIQSILKTVPPPDGAHAHSHHFEAV